jgi:hypothetical protein
MPRAANRSREKITRRDLHRLSRIAEADRDELFGRSPHLRHYGKRVICVALCQGAALHYVYPQDSNGIKDFDVWTFYAELGEPFPPRRRGKKDFGTSKFGRRPKDAKHFVGRRVDLMGRSLPVRPSADPVETVLLYLLTAKTKTAKELRKKPIVILDPPELRGAVVWPPGLAR